MPGAAHDSNPRKTISACLAYGGSHVRLASGLVQRRWRERFAHAADGFSHGLEDVCIIPALLDQSLPPPLRIGFAGSLCKQTNRIGGFACIDQLSVRW